jgi:hypothetical protein
MFLLRCKRRAPYRSATDQEQRAAVRCSSAEKGAAMNDQEIAEIFLPLWSDLRPEDAFSIKKAPVSLLHDDTDAGKDTGHERSLVFQSTFHE